MFLQLLPPDNTLLQDFMSNELIFIFSGLKIVGFLGYKLKNRYDASRTITLSEHHAIAFNS